MLTWEISFLVLLVENTYLLHKGAETGDGFAHNERVHSLRVGDDLRVYVHLDLPPREIEKMLHFREEGQFEGEGLAGPTRDLHTLISSMFEYYRPHVQSGDVFTISFQVQRN